MNALSAKIDTNKIYPGDKFILVVSRSAFLQELLCIFLEKETGAECHAFLTVADAAEEFKADPNKIALLLLDCCKMNPDKVMSDLKEGKIEFLTDCFPALMNVEPDLGYESIPIMEGVKGIFYENDSLEDLLKGIKAILSGEFWISKKVMTEFLLKGLEGFSYHQEAGKSSTLTIREKEILEIIVMGASNEETATRLCISPNTVRTHLYNIFKKIRVPNRLQAALWAAKNL